MAFLSLFLAAVALPGIAATAHADIEFEASGAPTQYTITEGVAKPYTIHSQVYFSKGFPLKPGQMLFTQYDKTPVPMPGDGKRAYAFTGVLGDIAKDGPGPYKQAASLSEVYDHHWVVRDNKQQNFLCPYGPNYVFGIGAESRTSPEKFPNGYGLVVQPGDSWGANIHLLRTDSGKYLKGDDPHTATKECNECYYAPNKGAGCSVEKNGTFQCCGENCYDGSCSCPTTAAAKDVPATTYYLRYEVNYTYDLDAITPISVGIYTTPSCRTFYEVYRNDAQPETLSTTTFNVPVDADILLMKGHQHTGSLNISLFHNDKLVCTSYPRYGTDPENTPGNEKGYLVHMSDCYNADDHDGQGYKLQAGDTLRLDSWYFVGSDDPRIAPTPGGTHLNVMGYMYTIYKTSGKDFPSPPTGPLPTASCHAGLMRYCGALVGSFADQCLACLTEKKQHILDAGCTMEMAEGACNHMGPAGGMRDGQKRRIVPTVV